MWRLGEGSLQLPEWPCSRWRDWRAVSIGLARVLWCSRCDPTTCFAQNLVGLARARHGATKANSFFLTFICTHLPCIAVPSFMGRPSVCTGLVLQTGITWREPALGSAPQRAQLCRQHPACTQGWMLFGCLVLVWSLGDSEAAGRNISHLPHSQNALGQQPVQV